MTSLKSVALPCTIIASVTILGAYFLQKIRDSDLKRRQKREFGIPDIAETAQRGFTKQQLAEYTGEATSQHEDIYISLKDVVYRVAPQYYGPGQSYHVYAGKEASRNLGKNTISDSECNLDWRCLSEGHLVALDSWVARFESKYAVVGWFVPDEDYYEKTKELEP